MKDITQYIIEKQDWWNNIKLIDKNSLLKFGQQALKNTKLFASDILEEINGYKDQDRLDDAYDKENLLYSKFVDELAELISDDPKYEGKEGDICDSLWEYVREFLSDLVKINSK